MDIFYINVVLAFLEGFALIISPCILPILPIILTGSLTGSKSRPIGIITGFVISFTLVTLFSRVLVQWTNLNPDVLRYASYVLLLLFGVVMISTTLTEKFNLLTQRLSLVGQSASTNNGSEGGYFGGVIFGALIGIVWTPCAGPILAAVIVQSIIQHTTLNSLLVVVAFAVGAGIPMLLIALLGRKIMSGFQFFKSKTGIFRKLLGLLIIISVIILMYETNLTCAIAEPVANREATSLINGLERPYAAPDIAGITAWINSPPLTIKQLKGKVVLIDFWTYSCINCIRTLPYIIDWYAKYHGKGFVVIGIHSPEFEFERNLSNVKDAVAKFGIRYPVALDNDFTTWQNYHNQYWPAHYLINQEGKVVYTHFGEGEYDVTENNIRYLLGIKTNSAMLRAEQSFTPNQTPETYLGTARAENFANTETVHSGIATDFHYPTDLVLNQWALNGKWVVYGDKIISAAPGAAIKLSFNAGIVYAVMGVRGLKPITVAIKINSKSPALIAGKEGLAGKITVKQNELYSIVDLKQPEAGIVELTADGPGLEMYTFTFGGQ